MQRPHSGWPLSHFTLDAPQESQLDGNLGGLDFRVDSLHNAILWCMLNLLLSLGHSRNGCFYVQIGMHLIVARVGKMG